MSPLPSRTAATTLASWYSGAPETVPISTKGSASTVQPSPGPQRGVTAVAMEIPAESVCIVCVKSGVESQAVAASRIAVATALAV